MQKSTARQKMGLRYSLITASLLAASTAIGYLFQLLHVPETNIVVVYLLSVILTSRLTKGYLFGIACSFLATMAFNYFFTQPYFTFSINDISYLITFTIMTITAILTSALTSKAKENESKALEKESTANALYQLTSQLSGAADLSEITGIIVRVVSQFLTCSAACLSINSDGTPEPTFLQQTDSGTLIHRELRDGDQLMKALNRSGESYHIGSEFYDLPIYGGGNLLAVLRIPKETGETLTQAQQQQLRMMMESAALAIDRYRNVQAKTLLKEEAARERYRGNLLRSISHDLRTPLASIMGSGEMLMDMTSPDDPRHDLAKDIYKDAGWLHALVENILNLTRLQDGKQPLHKQMEAVEEVIGAAVLAVEKRAPDHEITIHIPDEVLLVPMDAKLIQQVLINLLDNAVKHTPPGGEISVTAFADKVNHQAVLTVADRGSGIAESDLPHLFQMFYTTREKGADAQRGIGLGLTICESIVNAHKGTLSAKNRAGGGAEFTVTLPMEVPSDAHP
ncbi:MAG: DUF4118 domain-containing protein [Oscillospiraceae bacterium]|nr:DUF4118 domain-containing protein [Oscillospiraceae bacterium]